MSETYIIKTAKKMDSNSAHEFQAQLDQCFEQGIYNLTIDMSETAYISSIILRILLTAQKTVNKEDGSMVLTNVGEVVMEVLDVTGFSGILTIGD